MWSEEKSKIARRCGEKHILKWKCTKHHILGAHFEVLMSKNCTPLWPEAHFQVKMLKNWGSGSTFWSSDVEECTFWSQNAQNTTFSEHFLKFGKIARRCGEKRILKWKCIKHVRSGQFFEVLMSNNFMNLWREAHLSVKMYKIPVFWRTFSSSNVEQLVR